MEMSTVIAETRKLYSRAQSPRQESVLRLKFHTPRKNEVPKKPIDYFFNYVHTQVIRPCEGFEKNAASFYVAPNDLQKKTIQQLYFQQFRKLSVGA